MGGEIKREAFDLSSLKSKIENLSKGHDHCEDEECREYLLEYPLNQRRCVAALETLDKQRCQVEAEFRSEVQELEKKYLAKYQPLYDARAALIKGDREPQASEIGELPEDPVQEVDEKGQAVLQEAAVKGIPLFWLTALQNHPALSEMITEADAAALAALEDIQVSHLEAGPGFRLQFVFGENAFFANRVLTKEYHLAPPTSPMADDYVYDHATGSEIAWKDGKNLCFKTVTKTQRQKNGKGTRIVKREEPQDSFFHFFQPPTMDEEEDGEDEADIEELEQELEADYEMGDLIKCEIVPNAVHWFTGKALEYADYDDYFDEDDEERETDEDEDEDDSEDDSEEDSEEEDTKRSAKHRQAGRGQRGARPAQGGADQQQCKQQ